MNYRITKNKLVLVEGKDELSVLEYFLNQLQLEDLQVFDICGKTQFDSRLKILIRQPDFSKVTSIGIVRDADLNYESTMQSSMQILQNNNLNIVNNKTPSSPRILIFLMPGNKKNGCIEELFLSSKSNSPIMTCIDDYFICISKNLNAIPSSDKLSKAKTSVLLASNPLDPDKRFGESVKAGFWDTNSSKFSEFISFLKLI